MIVASLFSQCSLASDYSSEQDYFADLPVVLTASRLSQPLSESPNAMTVIDRAMIKASGFRTLTDLFRLVPGMFVGYENGHLPIVAYHGAIDNYSRQMQILIDGRSVYLSPTSSVSWEDIPLQIDDIERIEVVRGPAAASHGANSFQGVVNIITRDASGAGRSSVTVIKGSEGVSDATLHIGKTGPDLDYRATLAYRADNGFATPIVNDDHATHLANLRANYHPNATDSLDIQLGYNKSTGGLGVAGRPDSDPFRESRAYSSFEQFTWLHTLPQHDEFKLNYYHIHRNYSVIDTNGDLTPEREVIDRDEVELQHTTQWSEANRLVWGGGARTDVVDSPVWLAAPRSLDQSRLFAHDEWRMFKSAVLNAGAMFENDGMGHRNTSPRIALNYHLSPQHTVRVSSSVAYRNPAVVEENANMPGVLLSMGGVRPEKILSKEVGYLGEFNTGVSVDARIYYDRVKDIIYFDPAPNTGLPLSFSNLLSATYRGFESTIKYRWAERSNLTFNYSRQYASCAVTGALRDPAGTGVWGIPNIMILQSIAASCVTMVPQNSGSILLAQQIAQNIQFSAGYYHQGELQFWDTLAPITIMRRLDLKVAKPFGRPDEGEVALVVQNAFGDNYTEYAATPQTSNKVMYGRQTYLSATLRF